jgi:hypothetical protein
MNFEQQLIFAINQRRKITVWSGGCIRLIEPYLLFNSINHQKILHGWQYDGESNTTPPPDWINIRLDSIERICVDEISFGSTQLGYNPHSKRFKEVIVFVAK